MLAAYYETLLEEGLQGASIAKIARRLDVPPSLLIHYFGTKEQMTIELVDYLLEVYHETYGEKLESIADPLVRLRAIVNYLFSVEYHQLLDDRAFYALFYVSLTHPTVRRAFARVYEVSLDLVEATIAECMAAGHIPHDDAHQLAVTLKALEEGFAFLSGGGAGEDEAATLGEILRARALRQLGLPEAPDEASSRT
jgi:AcrR family transcriptional regulator